MTGAVGRDLQLLTLVTLTLGLPEFCTYRPVHIVLNVLSAVRLLVTDRGDD